MTVRVACFNDGWRVSIENGGYSHGPFVTSERALTFAANVEGMSVIETDWRSEKAPYTYVARVGN